LECKVSITAKFEKNDDCIFSKLFGWTLDNEEILNRAFPENNKGLPIAILEVKRVDSAISN